MNGQKTMIDFENSKMAGWKEIPVFLALARLGTLTAAAQVLHIAPSSVARHIEQLEQDLGTVLFQRSPQGYVLTEAAQAILIHAERAESAVNDAFRQSSSFAQEVSGTVRIALPENFANHLLIPALPDFQRRYPQLRIELATSMRIANLTRREADIAIRLSRPQHGQFIVSRIGQMTTRLYASAAYLARHPTEITAQGADHQMVGWDDTLQDMPLPQWLAGQLPSAHSPFTASTLQGHLEAAIAGAGLTALPDFLAGQLIPVGKERLIQDIYLITHSDVRRVPRIDVTMLFIRDLFAEWHERLFGGKN